MVVDAQSGLVEGLADAMLWHRRPDKLNKDERKYNSLPIEAKESNKWLLSTQHSQDFLAADQPLTFIADRESDLYLEWASVLAQSNHLLLRCKTDRKIAESPAGLWAALDSEPIAGRYSLDIRADKRKKRSKRKADIEVRYRTVTIIRPTKLPKTGPESIKLYAVEAKENSSIFTPRRKACPLANIDHTSC